MSETEKEFKAIERKVFFGDDDKAYEAAERKIEQELRSLPQVVNRRLS